MRIFVLPEEAENLLWKFPGEELFNPAKMLDEQGATREYCPLRESAAENLFRSTVNQRWEKFGISLPEDDFAFIAYHPQEKVLVSFHGWQDFASAIGTAQRLTRIAIESFDLFIEQYALEHPGPVRNDPPCGTVTNELAP